MKMSLHILEIVHLGKEVKHRADEENRKFRKILGLMSFCLDLGKVPPLPPPRFFVGLLSDGLLKSKLCIFTAACRMDCPVYKDFKTSKLFAMAWQDQKSLPHGICNESPDNPVLKRFS